MYGVRERALSLTKLQIAEIYYLSTEGCPCCKMPLRNDVLARAYHTSGSTVSRIRNLKQSNLPDGLPYSRKQLVELRKEVNERGTVANA